MKVAHLVLCCIILILCNKSANGDLHEFFGGLRSSARKAGDDLTNLLHLKKEDSNTSGNSEIGSDTNNDKPGQKVNLDAQKNTATVETSTQAGAIPAGPKSNATSIGKGEKEDRENFAGSCLAGYMRTADGRCKPTF